MARPLQSLRLRQAIVTRLRADSGLTALGETPISSGDPVRVYGRRTPAQLVWPFVRVHITDEGALRKGTDVRVTAHTFSKAQFDDEIEGLNAAVQAALEDATLTLAPGATAYLVWNASQVVPDAAESDAWHGVNAFTAAIG